MGMLVEILVICVAVILGIIILVNIVGPLFRAIGWLFKQLFRFIGGEITDIARLVGAIVTAIVYVPLVMVNLLIGRWSACSHYGRALQGEVGNAGLSFYRILIGHPLRLVGLGGALEGVEKRVPAVVQAAPGADAPPARAGKFEGYKIVGSLPGGGSGAKLYVAEPDAIKLASFEREGVVDVGQVVIKSFSLKDGSSLPQIVRESRSLDAAKKLRLILDHELAADRFYYVMRYVPGDSLTLMTRKLHASSPATGLADSQLRAAVGYVADLVGTLSVYHRGGLWHKDVKPDNIIIDGRDGRAHLVDFGLVSSLRSAMTLTTHGTEYFRDSEMVRLALKGVKVHEVDGTKFDIYGAGAVLYSVLEDSFPAHGVLSQFGKNSPECLRWIVRRAMTDYDKRYPSAEHMLADLRAVMACADPYAMKPFELPSMRDQSPEQSAHTSPLEGVVAAAASAVAAAGAAIGAAASPARASTPPGAGRRVRLKNWWTGEFEVEGTPAQAVGAVPPIAPIGAVPPIAPVGAVSPIAPVGAVSPIAPVGARGHDWVQDARRWASQASAAVAAGGAGGQLRSAEEQLRSARERLENAQGRARDRMARTSGRARSGDGKFRAGLNPGIFVAIAAFMGAIFFLRSARTADVPAPEMPVMNGAIPQIPDMPGAPEAPFGPGQPSLGSTLAQLPPLLNVSFIRPIDVSAVSVPTGVEGRVLVVNDVLQPWSDEFAGEFNGTIERLRSSGLEVRGHEGDVELVAQARLAVGQSAIDTTGAEAAVLEWLKQNSAEADVLVWISAAPADGAAPVAKPVAHVFNLDPASLAEEPAARARNVMGAVKWAFGAR